MIIRAASCSELGCLTTVSILPPRNFYSSILRVLSGDASTFSQVPKQAESRLPEMGNAPYDYQDSDLTPDTTGCACLLQFRTPRPSRPIPGA